MVKGEEGWDRGVAANVFCKVTYKNTQHTYPSWVYKYPMFPMNWMQISNEL
jgi:hypothetical protein